LFSVPLLTKGNYTVKPTNHPFFSFIGNLVGDEANHSLEARIFHVVTIIAIITASINMVINFWIGLTFYALLVLPLLGTLLYGFHLSRHQGKLNRAVIIFAVTFNFICGATYFSSEGSKSVNLFTFILIIFLLSFLSSKKQFNIWIPVTILHVFVLFVLEYYYPDLVKPLYANQKSRLIDVVQTWIEVAGMIAIITMYIQNNYNKEKQLAQNRLKSLEELNETRTKLFSIVSHDLRAPLSTIENYLSLLKNVELSPEEKQAVEQNLLASTKQTSEMLQNILSWSKDQMTGITLNLSLVNLTHVLNNTINLTRTLAQEKNIELTNTIDPNLQAMADADMLQLIIRNLLNNAIKFSSPGGKIHLSSILETDRCIIQVSDTGIGIRPGEGVDIFSVNYQGSYGTNNEKGVGLGLMLAKNYIELQHGEIWYENNPGKGVSFFISLPTLDQSSSPIT
jgi:two-component system sensor histidine kinase/response regulator